MNLSFSSHLVKENFWWQVVCFFFLSPSNSVKALAETQSTVPLRCHGLMLSSFITGLLKEVVLLLLHWLFDTSVVTILLKNIPVLSQNFYIPDNGIGAQDSYGSGWPETADTVPWAGCETTWARRRNAAQDPPSWRHNCWVAEESLGTETGVYSLQHIQDTFEHTDDTCLQFFGAVGWAAGRASGL